MHSLAKLEKVYSPMSLNCECFCSELPENRRTDILRYLVAMLPSANVDTLVVLIKFLQDVARHSYDTIGDEGVSVSIPYFLRLCSMSKAGPSITPWDVLERAL